MREQDQQIRVLHELSAMTSHLLRSPPLPISFPNFSVLSPPPRQNSPAAFGSLFIGISIALMLFGSVTFIIGFILLPLVITLLILFYVIGFVSNLTEIGRAILWQPPYSSSFSPVWNEIRFLLAISFATNHMIFGINFVLRKREGNGWTCASSHRWINEHIHARWEDAQVPPAGWNKVHDCLRKRR